MRWMDCTWRVIAGLGSAGFLEQNESVICGMRDGAADYIHVGTRRTSGMKKTSAASLISEFRPDSPPSP